MLQSKQSGFVSLFLPAFVVLSCCGAFEIHATPVEVNVNQDETPPTPTGDDETAQTGQTDISTVPDISFAMAHLVEGKLIFGVKVLVPYVETVTQTYTVEVPYTETITDKNGKQSTVTHQRTETRTQEIPVTRMMQQYQQQTWDIDGEGVKFYLMSGQPLNRDQIASKLATPKLILTISKGTKLTGDSKRLFAEDAIVAVFQPTAAEETK